MVRDLDLPQTIKLLNQGLAGNLQKASFNPDNLRFVHAGIKREAERMLENKTLLDTARLADSFDLQSTAGNGEATSDGGSLHEGLKSWLASSKSTETLDRLINRYQAEISNHPGDYWSQFELGWIYLHLKSDAETAYRYFAAAAEKSVEYETPLAELTLRYMAVSAHINGDNRTAASAVQNAASISHKKQPQYDYETARYYAALDNTDKSVTILRKLIKESPLYYTLAEADLALNSHEPVEQLLARFHAAKLEAIKQKTLEKWHASPYCLEALPKEFDGDALYEQTLQDHAPLLQHQPFNAIFKTDAIAGKITKNIEAKAKAALRDINAGYDQTMRQIKRRWKIVNIAGVGLLYIAMLLTLSSIFLFVGSDFAGTAFNTGTENIDWGALTPKIFGAVVVSAIIGIMLTRFDPPSLKKLARKKGRIMHLLDSAGENPQ